MYHHRVIYLTQIGDKFQMFYRSSGLAGHDSTGNILPCYTLKTTYRSLGDEFGGMCHGWITKVYKKGHFVNYYSKDMEKFPLEMQKYFVEIGKYDFTETILEQDNPITINEFVADYIKSGNDWVDWGTYET